jgi:hypothetical protein
MPTRRLQPFFAMLLALALLGAAGLAVFDIALTPLRVVGLAGAAALLAAALSQLRLAVRTARWNAGYRLH